MHAEPFRKAQAEAVEESGLSAVGSHDATQPDLALRYRSRRQDDIGTVDGRQFLEDGARAIAETP